MIDEKKILLRPSIMRDESNKNCDNDIFLKMSIDHLYVNLKICVVLADFKRVNIVFINSFLRDLFLSCWLMVSGST